MARPRAFDEGEVLDAAIACFWRRGLEATSVRDLAAEMGINGPSLYNAFGDKRQLFVQALERYAAQSMRERIRRLEGQHAPKRAIREFVGELIQRSVADTDRRGCMIVNAALEVAPHDAELRAIIAAYLGEIEAFFRRSIERGRAEGTIPAQVAPRDTARLFLAVILGIRVAARSGSARAALDGMARPALKLLDHAKRQSAGGAT